MQPLTQLSSDEQLFRSTVRDFARAEIAPLVRQMDEEAHFDAGLLRKLHELGADLLLRPVSDIMTTLEATCTPDDSVDSLSALMTEKRVRHVPVVVNGRLAGIVSIGDVVKTRMEELETQQEQLQAYITQGR